MMIGSKLQSSFGL